MRIRNPLATTAVVMSGIQLFIQMVDAKGLVTGVWWSLGGMAVAAAVLTINGYMHAYRQQGQADVTPGATWSQPMPPVWEPAPAMAPMTSTTMSGGAQGTEMRHLAPNWRGPEPEPTVTTLRQRMAESGPVGVN